MITIPTADAKKWSQENSSDLTGNVFVTKNITFDDHGYLQLSNSSRAAYSQETDASFDEPAVFIRSEDYGYFTVTHDSCYSIDASRILGVSPAIVATAGVPTGDLQSDAVFFGGLMVVSQDTDVDFYDPSTNTWTDTNIALTLTSGSQHPLANMVSFAALAVANVRTVSLYSSPITATPTLFASGGVNSILSILADFYITGMCYFNQNLYIGTMNRYGGKAYMYVWDGTGTAAQSAYEVDSNIIWDICVYRDSVALINGTGELLRFNGSGFDTLANFPCFYADRPFSDETNLGMFKNCLKANGDLIYINLSTTENSQKLTSQPDGVWCYDPEVGLYHRYSLSNSVVVYDTIPTAGVNTTTNEITVAAAPITGTECLYNASSATVLAPLLDGTRYYVIKINSTTIKLATTLANANSGTAIDLTSTGNSNQVITFFPNIDFGQSYNGRVEAILPIDRVVTSPQFGTDLLWGGSVYMRSNSATGMMGTTSTEVQSRGYFITPKIFSTDVTSQYNQFTLKFSEFLTENDKIVIKYRTEDDRKDFFSPSSTRWNATWTSTTTFTTTETEFSTAVVGDEIEFVRGAASGYIMHITAISESAGTYTVTLDEAFDYYTAGDTSNFISRNWTKWQTIAYGDSNAELHYLSEQLGVEGKFVQFKIELRGKRVRIEELLVDEKYRLPAKG